MPMPLKYIKPTIKYTQNSTRHKECTKHNQLHKLPKKLCDKHQIIHDYLTDLSLKIVFDLFKMISVMAHLEFCG